ncbi:MAG: hypothetical protein AB1499_04170 [Nitrospirota bacterium]
MTGLKIDILFAIMAVQEVVFFVPVARRLSEEEGLKVAFLTFHEAGDDILEKERIPYLSLHKLKRSAPAVNTEPADIEKSLGVDMEHLIFHEMHTSGRKRAGLEAKTVNYCSIFDNILRTNEIGCIVQELGGFIAPLTLYYIARKNSVNHVFIEPAMFRKRVVFTLNRFYADITDPEEAATEMSDELSQLLNEYMTKKTVVIPKKDRHFFQDMTFKRLFSSDNFSRLRRKLYHKYVLGREEEYNWIMRYINMHVIKAIRRKLLSKHYTHPAQGEKYVYYPFHVPLDVQLTARCPEFFDQESLVGRIAESLPEGYRLYIKEHPAAIGGHSLPKLKDVLARHANIKLIHPLHNSYDIIKHAACIVTVNSKVGVEAIMQGRPVVVLGRTFYRGKGVTIDVDDMNDLSKAVADAVNLAPDIEKSRLFLNRAFKWSCKGELYENSPQNVNDFYDSLKGFLLKSKIIANVKRELQEAGK